MHLLTLYPWNHILSYYYLNINSRTFNFNLCIYFNRACLKKQLQSQLNRLRQYQYPLLLNQLPLLQLDNPELQINHSPFHKPQPQAMPLPDPSRSWRTLKSWLHRLPDPTSACSSASASPFPASTRRVGTTTSWTPSKSLSRTPNSSS